jgi:C4-dicarboxylate transporter DctM subunit
MATQTIVGFAGFAIMLIMVLSGIPIFVSMLSVCFVGFMLLGGWTFTLTQFMQAPFTLAASYSFAVLPLFMLLGVLAGETGVGEGAYNSVEKWTAKMPGGLMMATVGGNALFGAVSGMSIAGNMVFCKIAMPELVKHGYDKSLSMGVITASGALNCLIPPSMPIIIFCVLTNYSIGRSLMAGVGPAILLLVLLCCAILVLHRIWPNKVPGAAAFGITWMDRLKSLKLLLPVLGFFVVVIGGTYWGWFSATVAGAIGSMILIIYGLFRGISLKYMIKATWEACVMNAGFFPIIIAGTMFSRFISLSRLPDHLADWITTVNVPPYVFCGAIMDIASIIIITIPVVVPLLTSVGFDPYVLVIVLVFVGEMAGLTPPIGMNVFAVANALRVDPGVIFKGIWPFFIVEFIVALILPVVPQITTFIPNVLGGG